jgi:hypothetical protein
MNNRIKRTLVAGAMIALTLGGGEALFAQADTDTNSTTISYWQMNGLATLNENPITGVGILDLATNTGQGVLNGSASSSGVAAPVDNLWVSGQTLPGDMVFIGSVPPTSMFKPGHTPGLNSWDAGANMFDAGEVFFPPDVYGDELRVPSFTEEVYFKSDAESTTKQTLIWNHHNSAYAQLQINESADSNPDDAGSLLFWGWDGQNFPTVRITAAQNAGQRFDDGHWHYAAARFDATTMQMSLLVVNDDGSSFASSQILSAALNPGGGVGETIIANDELSSTPYNGQINQLRFSSAALPNDKLLAPVPDCFTPVIQALSQPTTNYLGDVAYFAVAAGGLNLSYQWRFNGTPVSGQTNTLYGVFPVESTNAGNYDVVVSAPCGLSVTSNPIQLTVISTIRPPVNLARWSMEAQISAPNNNGSPTFAGVADSDTNLGQGVFTTGSLDPAIDDLITFNGATGGVVVTNDVPPTSMFINGNTGGANSYLAASLDGVDGALFFPQDQYGDELDFQTSFSVEIFFKTISDQSAGGQMQLIAQGSDGSDTIRRYGIDLNEAAPGSITFGIIKGGNYQTVNLTGANYADGKWHYVLAQYDALNNQLNLSAGNQDGTSASAAAALPAGYGPLDQGNTGNTFIGRFNYPFNPPTDQPRNFTGMIDEVQVSSGLVTPATGQLGALATSTVVTPHITGISMSGSTMTITFTGASTDVPSAFTVVASSLVAGSYSPVTATVASTGTGSFQATIAMNGTTQFYRIRR